MITRFESLLDNQNHKVTQSSYCNSNKTIDEDEGTESEEEFQKKNVVNMIHSLEMDDEISYLNFYAVDIGTVASEFVRVAVVMECMLVAVVHSWTT